MLREPQLVDPMLFLQELSEPVGASSSQNLCRSWNTGRRVALNASCHFRCSSCSGAHLAVNCPGPASIQLQTLSLAACTRKSYATPQSQFISFYCQLGRIHSSGSPCPADEWTLCLFALFLASSLQYSSNKVHLSGVRALHIGQGFADPLQNCLRLQRVIRAIKHT